MEGTIEWTEDPDFGYEVAASIPGVDDLEILQPRRLYERQGRMDEHEPWWPGSSGSGRSSSAPSPAWTSPWSSRSADQAPSRVEPHQ